MKIDRSFIIDLARTQEGQALVSTIISLAHALKLTVVAEGVETEEQRRLLKLLLCDQMQGFLFCPPVSRDEFETRFLRSGASRGTPSLDAGESDVCGLADRRIMRRILAKSDKGFGPAASIADASSPLRNSGETR